MACWNSVRYFADRHIGVAHAQNTDITVDVQKLANNWMNAYNNKDAATIANMYAENGIFSNANWTASGRTAIADALNKEFALGVKFTAIQSINHNGLVTWLIAEAPGLQTRKALKETMYRSTVIG